MSTKKSIISRPLMRFLAWLAGFSALAIIADKLAGYLMTFHIYTGL